MGHRLVGKIREGQARPLLPAHSARSETTRDRALEVGCPRPRDASAAESRKRGGVMKLAWWLRRNQRERDLREELEFHLSEEADERKAFGLCPDDARVAAYRALGNV